MTAQTLACARLVVPLCVAFTLASAVVARAQAVALPPALEAFTTPYKVPRVALVMGAQNYTPLDPVPNAINDAQSIATSLGQAGFSTIRFVKDPTTSDIGLYVSELAALTSGVQQPAIIVLFFAGHGFQREGHPYIVPVNADLRLEGSVSVASLVDQLGMPDRGLTIVLLDSCRNPVTAGAAPVAVATLRGALLGLATKFNWPTSSAAHLGATQSPYTTALMRYMLVKGADLPRVLGRVTTEVEVMTRREQSPDLVNGADAGGFYFVPTAAEREAEAAAWRATVAFLNERCAEKFIKSHPDSLFVRDALRFLGQKDVLNLRTGDEECPDDLR